MDGVMSDKQTRFLGYLSALDSNLPKYKGTDRYDFLLNLRAVLVSISRERAGGWMG